VYCEIKLSYVKCYSAMFSNVGLSRKPGHFHQKTPQQNLLSRSTEFHKHYTDRFNSTSRLDENEALRKLLISLQGSNRRIFKQWYPLNNLILTVQQIFSNNILIDLARHVENMETSKMFRNLLGDQKLQTENCQVREETIEYK
jgi:hypothetical protein